MEHLTEPTLWAFLFQAVVAAAAWAPLSYLAYRWVRAPLKRERVKQSLSQLGIVQTKELEETMTAAYHLKDYIWPLFMAYVFMSGIYTVTHPYVIRLGLWSGWLEEVIDIFGADDLFPRAILWGRFLFWGWLGACIYSVHLVLRRFLAYDLTPSVYLFTANRSLLAIAISAIVGTGLGTFSKAAGVPFDVNMATVSIVAFFIGFFPEQGLNWIAATAKKALGQRGGIAKETRLSEIEGLSIWHQGRLKQEGIENVQNLATADVPALVIGTPFPVNQIVDWVDQAILLAYASQEQFEALEKAGVLRASDVLTTTSDDEGLNDLADAAGLKKSELKVLSRALQSALNIKMVARFRWQTSMDAAKVEEAAAIGLLQPSPAPAPMELPREQEEMMFEGEE
ncbi:MAG: hypothetical protein ACETWR_05630 [Anaerolineae bacterium]